MGALGGWLIAWVTEDYSPIINQNHEIYLLAQIASKSNLLIYHLIMLNWTWSNNNRQSFFALNISPSDKC